MNNYINIFNTRIDDLIKISINHRKNDGNGVIFCNFTDKDKLDVYFIPLLKDGEICETFPKELVNYYIDKYKTMPSSFIYFNLFDNNENLNIELDLDKKSNYSNLKYNNENNQ